MQAGIMASSGARKVNHPRAAKGKRRGTRDELERLHADIGIHIHPRPDRA